MSSLGTERQQIKILQWLVRKKKYVYYYFLDTVFNPSIINGEIYYSPLHVNLYVHQCKNSDNTV
jgi:hypothetical protein